MKGRAASSPAAPGIRIKKEYGQHFLRNPVILENICHAVALDTTTSVFEIGCGDGALTRTILHHPVARLWVFEIDHEWVTYVRTNLPDARLTLFEENILTVPLAERLAPHAPWVLLANLPYNITFPILRLLHAHRQLIREAVVMVQDEVAVKLLKQKGRDYGPASLFYQHYFEMRSLGTIPPDAFHPPPKVNSRLIHLMPRRSHEQIPDEERFWRFVGQCFAYPRRTLRNNLAGTPYECLIARTTHPLHRAQEMKYEEFLELWQHYLTTRA